MLSFLPPTARGVVAALLLVLNVLFWTSILFALALVRLVLPFRPVRRRLDPLLNRVASNWISGNSAWMRLTQRTEWDVEGLEGLDPNEWYMVSANHQTWVDIFVLQHVLNRRIPPDVASPHLDLLPLARRLWRRRLVSCALGSLENNLLGLQRSGADVPGYLIPQLYREYVDYGLAEPMAGVFYHNVQDVLSMVSLSAIAGQTLSALGNPDMAPAADFLALGKLFTRLGRHDDALRAMELAAGSGPDRDEQALALRQWSMLLKRLGKWQEAADIWEAQLGPDSLYAYEELAKYHEHQRRDPYAAAVVVRQALEQLAAQGAVLSRLEAQLYENSFRHRLERLERRTARQDGTR